MNNSIYHYHPDYIHHNPSLLDGVVREVVFGLEDGMVSTLGTITGIAVGSQHQGTVILAGFVIIAVESISMGIGSYLSSKSEEEVKDRKLMEEQKEIEEYPAEEEQELKQMYTDDGWPEKLANEMARVVSERPNLMLKEMALRELHIFPHRGSSSLKGGITMFASYVVGGCIPLLSYLLFPIQIALPISIAITLLGLFALGGLTTKFTKQPFVRSGIRMLVVGSVALAVGLVVGVLVGK